MKTTVGLVSYKQNAKPSNPGSLTNPFSLMCSADVLPLNATQASISDKAAREKTAAKTLSRHSVSAGLDLLKSVGT
jgi:hypothetical protein